MADSTIPSLDAVTAPLATDVFSVRQSADARDKKMTRAQVHSLVSGEHLILPFVDETATPTFAFGDGDTGLFEQADDQLSVSIAGVQTWNMIGTDFQGNANNSARISNAAASATGPSLVPSRNDGNTGIGWPGSDQLSLIAGSLDCINIAETGAAREIGFYVTTPIPLQTGVAVTAAGIHAALVALGLITA